MTEKFDKVIKDMISKYGKSEVKDGMEVEKEHEDVIGKDKLKRAKIARAHLREKPDYYEKLKKYVE